MGFEVTELRKFTEVGRAVTAAARISVEDWAMGESGVILKRWTGMTKVASEERVTVEARYRAGKQAFGGATNVKNPFGITVNTGKRDGIPGKVWNRTKLKNWQEAGQIRDDATWIPAWKHFGDEAWKRIDAGGKSYAATLAKMKPMALKAVGLARQSVVQIADQLGISLESVRGGTANAAGIAKARSALASDGRYYQNGRGIRDKDSTSFFVEMINGYPRIQELRMDETLEAIVRDRMGETRRALESKVFESAQRTTRVFPYISPN